jgi:hypothetical protein
MEILVHSVIFAAILRFAAPATETAMSAARKAIAADTCDSTVWLRSGEGCETNELTGLVEEWPRGREAGIGREPGPHPSLPLLIAIGQGEPGCFS